MAQITYVIVQFENSIQKEVVVDSLGVKVGDLVVVAFATHYELATVKSLDAGVSTTEVRIISILDRKALEDKIKIITILKEMQKLISEIDAKVAEWETYNSDPQVAQLLTDLKQKFADLSQ